MIGLDLIPILGGIAIGVGVVLAAMGLHGLSESLRDPAVSGCPKCVIGTDGYCSFCGSKG